MENQRLQKIIAEAGICSRRKAELIIKQRRIKVNGEIANIGEKADINVDHITLDGSPINNIKTGKIILLNKPIGYISSCQDPQGRPTLLSLLPFNLRKGLYPIGRLDLNSRGAILVSNNGLLTLKLTHPRYSHSKTYHVTVSGLPTEKSLSLWRNGLTLDGKRTLKAKVEVLEGNSSQTLLKIIMFEGRKRQIRRIANIIGCPVIDLKRIAIGPIQLNDLKEGDWRILKKGDWEHILDN